GAPRPGGGTADAGGLNPPVPQGAYRFESCSGHSTAAFSDGRAQAASTRRSRKGRTGSNPVPGTAAPTALRLRPLSAQPPYGWSNAPWTPRAGRGRRPAAED